MNIAELRAKRAALVAEARKVLDAYPDGKLSAEDRAKYDAIDADIDLLTEQVKREEKLVEMEARTAEKEERQTKQPQIGENRQTEQSLEMRATPEYRERFNAFLRTGEITPELRAMTVATDAKGGYTVPEAFQTTVIEKANSVSVMRQICDVLPTSSVVRIPLQDGTFSTYWFAENGTITESDNNLFTQAAIDAYKLGCLGKISEELLQDSFIDVEAYVAKKIGEAFAAAEETKFCQGTGSGEPTGFLTTATAVDTASSGVIVSDDLIDAYFAIKSGYRAKAVWLMSDTAVKAVCKLKDKNDQYLWQPGLQPGKPDTLLGKPLHTSDGMPAFASSAKPIAFGDFKNYTIGQRGAMSLQRLVELYSANGMIGFRAVERVDGILTLSEAVTVKSIKA